MFREIEEAVAFVAAYFYYRLPRSRVDLFAERLANALLRDYRMERDRRKSEGRTMCKEMVIDINARGKLAVIIVEAASVLKITLQEISALLPSAVQLRIAEDSVYYTERNNRICLYRSDGNMYHIHPRARHTQSHPPLTLTQSDNEDERYFKLITKSPFPRKQRRPFEHNRNDGNRNNERMSPQKQAKVMRAAYFRYNNQQLPGPTRSAKMSGNGFKHPTMPPEPNESRRWNFLSDINENFANRRNHRTPKLGKSGGSRPRKSHGLRYCRNISKKNETGVIRRKDPARRSEPLTHSQSNNIRQPARRQNITDKKMNSEKCDELPLLRNWASSMQTKRHNDNMELPTVSVPNESSVNVNNTWQGTSTSISNKQCGDVTHENHLLAETFNPRISLKGFLSKSFPSMGDSNSMKIDFKKTLSNPFLFNHIRQQQKTLGNFYHANYWRRPPQITANLQRDQTTTTTTSVPQLSRTLYPRYRNDDGTVTDEILHSLGVLAGASDANIFSKKSDDAIPSLTTNMETLKVHN